MKKILALVLLAGFLGTLAFAIARPLTVTAENISWGELKCRYHPTYCKPPTNVDDKREG